MTERTSLPLPLPDPSAVVETLRGRRSVGQPRLAGSALPDHAVVRDALESARWAPNHKHTEPWRFYLLDDERIHALAELNAAMLERDGAPDERVAIKREQWAAVQGVVIITVRSEPDADDVTRREVYAAVACAAQNFMLHLWACGVASKWSTSAVWRHEGFWPLLGHAPEPDDSDDDRVLTAAPGADGEEVVGIFFYGTAESVPAGKRRLPLEAVLTDFRG